MKNEKELEKNIMDSVFGMVNDTRSALNGMTEEEKENYKNDESTKALFGDLAFFF